MNLKKFYIRIINYIEIFKYSQQLSEFEIAKIEFYSNNNYFYIYKFSSLKECKNVCTILYLYFQNFTNNFEKNLLDDEFKQAIYDSKYINESNELINYLKDIIKNHDIHKFMNFLIKLQLLTLDVNYSLPDKRSFIELFNQFNYLNNFTNERFKKNFILCLNQVSISLIKHSYIRFYCINLFEQLLPEHQQKFE